MMGSTKVNAAPTEMGPFGHQGSAAKAMALTATALDLQLATSASGIIQLGMAFGVDPTTQSAGDVLVSTSLIPYDNRDVVSETAQTVAIPLGAEELEVPSYTAPVSDDQPYRTDYTRAKRHYSKQSLLRMLQREAERGDYDHRIFFGGLLSGAARIFSRRFLKELVTGVPGAEDGIIGGDMEGVGLLSVSPPEDPTWMVVKAISDFADENRGNVAQHETQREEFEKARLKACLNSARFVLRALANAELE
jgi:adenosylhomocysteine nucleosidase